MPKRKQRERQQCPEDIVRHPRYGTKPIESGCSVDHDTLRNGYWQYRGERIYPATAIEADIDRQNYTTFPREYYVDIQKACRDCARSFIFFAREQRFWYEVLKLYIDVDCVRCPECRKENRATKRHRAVFSQHIVKPPTEVRKLVALLEAGVYLWNCGELRNEHTLRRLRKLAHTEMKSHPVREQLDALVESITSEQ